MFTNRKIETNCLTVWANPNVEDVGEFAGDLWHC